VRLRFRDFLFDVGTRSLTRGGRAVPLSPKAFSLLEVLVTRRPDAVSHEELRRTLWSDATNGGTTLARLVSEIRTALGDDDDEQPFIRTVHRFGYAFAEAAAEEERPTHPVGRYAIRWGSQLVPLGDGENLIGRALDGVIAVPSSKASRRHARIVVSPEKAIIEDLGSRNGTRVNDVLIDRPVELQNGDRIGVGPAVLVFCVAGSSNVTSEDSGVAPDDGGPGLDSRG
jgi:DNA-binding winged helix-turn-helix (wHTH) protein